ncbi:hypothetical protein BCR35DRAFT_85786 [Leucosporidium creatinivorum]|uniref:Trichome birefringence-like C-terminal domain-containing protein n=1 Tax=Leucosporidium creatinivorum TaxID=106004 RepID=A0A1Y2FG73_9BASI|nr:hypothetical protein BCR35DRAFT_85786 [Leucosporidium creatinivorum]
MREEEGMEWQRSLVVTSVGNWWERWVEKSPSVSESLTLYRRAVHLAISHILDLTASPYDYTFFFRTVNRGHSHCENFENPIEKHDTRAMDQDQYSWYLKSPMSDIWRAGLAPHLSTPSSSSPPSNTSQQIHLLDIVEQAYQRPDAHRFPPEDCLHWCLPSVLDDWNWTWWHLLSASEEVAVDGREE